MIQYHADWIVPVTSPPIRDGSVAVDGHRIVAVGAGRSAFAGVETLDLGSVAILPGLVNAHTHLELSWMRGLVGPHDRFTDWARALIARRREITDPNDPRLVNATTEAIAEAVRCGTALVGDISNTLTSYAPLAAQGVPAVLFHELLGFDVDAAEGRVRQARAALDALTPHEMLRTSLAPHAPYSVAPGLFRAIRDDLDGHSFSRSSVHLAESTEEVEFLDCGTGPWRAILEDLGAWNPKWTPPRSAPAEYVDSLGFLDARVLVVHGVQLTSHELRRLASRAATLVTCPRGNIRTGAGNPPVERFYESGVAVAIGTDSLASVDDLNVFSEIATLRRLAPRVPAAALLRSATWVGATALGFEGEFGAIEPGRRARLLAVDIPRFENNVEEYLVNGIVPSQMRWVG